MPSDLSVQENAQYVIVSYVLKRDGPKFKYSELTGVIGAMVCDIGNIGNLSYRGMGYTLLPNFTGLHMN